ncbi:hypothetical protein FB451DRAFT_1094774, partial [Mycena latifolia]
MQPVVEDVPNLNDKALIAPQSLTHFFPNATGFGIEGSQFTNVLGNMNIVFNIHSLAAPSAVREQSTGVCIGGDLSLLSLQTATENGPVDAPGDAYSDSRSYCSQLLRRGRGFPLSIPVPQPDLPREYQRQGVAIGDVGRVTPEGIFDFFFNIYLDADDPINAENVPEDFYPLKSYASRDIVSVDFEPGSNVSTPSTQRHCWNMGAPEGPWSVGKGRRSEDGWSGGTELIILHNLQALIYVSYSVCT